MLEKGSKPQSFTQAEKNQIKFHMQILKKCVSGAILFLEHCYESRINIVFNLMSCEWMKMEWISHI